MSDRILESIFLDDALWAEVLDWGIHKGIPHIVLSAIQDPHGRAELCEKIALGEYQIQPPHTGYARKDDGSERTFLVNDPLTRILFHAVCLWLMRNESDMIHPACLSYHEGIGIGKVVKGVSQQIQQLALKGRGIAGRKFDIHHYFDTVPRQLIHNVLDTVEQHYGASAVIALVRQYYDSDTYYDTRRKEYQEKYMGIKQGCAVSSWFANVLLYSLDEDLASLGECYVRYSDDILYVGSKYKQATSIICSRLKRAGLQLNEKKTENITPDRFFRFLGFDICGAEVTLSRKWVKSFQHNIDALTIHDKGLIKRVRALRQSKSPYAQVQLYEIIAAASRRVVRFLYYGNGVHSWANLALPIINRASDVSQLNNYCLDALRAVVTGKTNIGGLGRSMQGGITRGKGRNVKANRIATEKWIKGYCSAGAMQKALQNKWLYRALVHDLLLPPFSPELKSSCPSSGFSPSAEDLESAYSKYLSSIPDGKRLARFYARPLSEFSYKDMLAAGNRTEACQQLISLLKGISSLEELSGNTAHWFWQSRVYPELVILKGWISSLPSQQ